MTQIDVINNELNKRGISQKEFCDAIGIFPSTYSTWKSKNKRIPSKYIVPISNFFEWPAQKLIEIDSDEKFICESSMNNNLTNSNITSSNFTVNSSNANGLESEFLESFNKLSFSDKSKVIALVAELSEGENNEG